VLRTALKPRWLALFVVVVVASAFMARLGQWQWDRAHDNAGSSVERTLARPPVPLRDVLTARQRFTGAAADRAVVAEGGYDAARQVLVADRRLAGETGWWVLTPLVLDDGSAVGVVRGWVATADDPAAAVAAVPVGRVAVTGHLRPAEPPADRAPGETSGLPDGQVDRVDLTQLIERWPWPLLTGYVVLTRDQDVGAARAPVVAPVPAPSLRPVPAIPEGRGGLDLRNLSYALQWFLFAAFGLFMWWRLVRDDHVGVLDDGRSEPTPEGATL
jgi:cytochrome oxidase assembly protein ShyY1